MRVLNWKQRFGLTMSIIWVLAWLLMYLDDSFMPFKTKVVGFLAIGVLPVVLAWLGVWTWEGHKLTKRK